VNRIVLDASAVLAMILNEPGGERVDALLDALELGSDAEVFISSVNWCEILTRMQREKLAISGERLSAVLTGVELVPLAGPSRKLQLHMAMSVARFRSGIELVWRWPKANRQVPGQPNGFGASVSLMCRSS